MVMLGFSDIDFTHCPVANATRATLSVVNSCAMIALQPSVPNLICIFIIIVHKGKSIFRK
jgi:hypothetical protein